MNLVMQLRKVCNHPELLNPKETQSPLRISDISHYNAESLNVTLSGINTMTPTFYKEIHTSNNNPIKFKISKLMFDELFGLWNLKCKSSCTDYWYGVSNETYNSLFKIHSSSSIYDTLYNNKSCAKFNDVGLRSFTKSSFSVLILFGLTLSQIEYLSYADSILSLICMMHYKTKTYSINKYKYLNEETED